MGRFWLFVALVATTAFIAASTASAQQGRELWRYNTGWHLPLSIAPSPIDASILYIAQKGGGLLVLEEKAKGKPRRIAAIGRGQLGNLDAMDLTIEGDTLYVALGDHFRKGRRAGLAVIDISRTKQPKLLGLWKSKKPGTGAAEIIVGGGYAYLGAMKAGIHIIDIRNPARPRQVSTYLPDIHFPKTNPGSIAHPNARGLALSGDRLYVAFDAGGLRVVDVRDKARPREIGRYINRRMGKKQQAYNNVIVNQGRAYIALDYCGLEVVDVSNARNMKQLSWWNPWKCETRSNNWFNSPGHTNQLHFDPQSRHLLLSAGDSEMIQIDVTNPRHPKPLYTHGKARNGLGVWGVSAQDSKVYLTYIRTPIPFSGRWAGVRAIRLSPDQTTIRSINQ